MTVIHRVVLASALLLPASAGAHPPGPADHGVPAREGRPYEVVRVHVERSSAAQEGAGEPLRGEWSRVFKLPGRGSLDLSNLSGDIVVTGGAGDEIRVHAVREDGSQAGRAGAEDIRIVVNEGAGRVEIRTEYPRRGRYGDVDFNVQVPAYADVNIRSVSGDVRVEKVQGEVRGESVSGDVVVADVRTLLLAKSVSGEVTVTGAGGDAVNAESVSGGIHAQGLTANDCRMQSVSGELTLTGAKCGRAHLKTISGGIEYAGSLAAGGRYEFSSHSGDVRLSVGGGSGFELVAKTFSGSMESALPMTRHRVEDGDHRPRGRMRGTVGDGSAYVDVKTFSGSIVVE